MSSGSAAEVAIERLERLLIERQRQGSREDAMRPLPAEPRPAEHGQRRWVQSHDFSTSADDEFVVDWALGTVR